MFGVSTLQARANYLQTPCFFELHPAVGLPRRALAEGVGTMLLVVAAAAPGQVFQQLMPANPAITLLATAIATAGALSGLILALGAVSGGHFNPLITALQWLGRERDFRDAACYIAAQLSGALVGALFTNEMSGEIFRSALHGRPSARNDLSELLASAGLLLIVFGCSRSALKEAGAIAVGAWLAGAIVATPSHSFANPAIVFAAIIAAGPISISSSTALFYIAAEIVGALLAFVIVEVIYPTRSMATPEAGRLLLRMRFNEGQN